MKNTHWKNKMFASRMVSCDALSSFLCKALSECRHVPLPAKDITLTQAHLLFPNWPQSHCHDSLTLEWLAEILS